MARIGLSLSLRLLVILVIGMAVIAFLAGSFYNKTLPFVQDQESHANASALRTCEERVETYCTIQGGDWGNRFGDCTKYKDAISGGDTQCD